MDSDVIKSFNKTLVSMQESKGGIVSKQKVVEITKAAMAAVRYFKHVIFIIERYLAKCRQEFKVPALYIMDSILRQAKKQYKHKDVFGPRFAVNLSTTINSVLACEPSERLKVVRVINLWQAHQIFSDEALLPVFQLCRDMGLEVDPTMVERMVKGEKADMQLYQQPPGSELALSQSQHPQQLLVPKIPTTPTEAPPPPSAGPHSAGSGPALSLEERLSQFSRQKLGIGRANSTTNTPQTAESGPKTPPLEDQDHRISTGQLSVVSADEIPLQQIKAEGLAGSELLQLLVGVGLTAQIVDNAQTLQRVQTFMNEKIKEQLETENRRQGNIGNLLSRDFDYSDEDEDDERDTRKNNGSIVAGAGSPQLADIPKEKLLNIARQLLADSAVQQEVHKLATNAPFQSPVKLPPQPFAMPNFSIPPPNVPNGAAGPGPMFLPIVPPSVSLAGMLPPCFSASMPPPAALFSMQANNAPMGQQPMALEDNNRPVKQESDTFSTGRERDSRRHSDQRERDSRGGGGDRSSRKRRSEWSPDEKDSRSSRRDEKSSRRSGGGTRGGGEERRKRSRSRGSGESPRHRERDKEKEQREREREQREKDRDLQEKERRRIGLPGRTKPDHVLIASRTLWFGRIPASASEQDIVEALKEAGVPEKVTIVSNRACAYVTMADRKSAYKIIDRLARNIQVLRKNIKMDWATIPGVKDDSKIVDFWDIKRGYAEIPFSRLPDGTVDKLMEGAWLELETLPAHLKERYSNTGLMQLQQIQMQLAQQQQQQQQQSALNSFFTAQQQQSIGALTNIPTPSGPLPTPPAGLFNNAMFSAAHLAAGLMALPPPAIQFPFPPPQIQLSGTPQQNTPHNQHTLANSAPTEHHHSQSTFSTVGFASAFENGGFGGGSRGAFRGRGAEGGTPRGRGEGYRGRGGGRGRGDFHQRFAAPNNFDSGGGGFRGGSMRGGPRWDRGGRGRGRGGGGFNRGGCDSGFRGRFDSFGGPQHSESEGNIEMATPNRVKNEGTDFSNSGFGNDGFSNAGFGTPQNQQQMKLEPPSQLKMETQAPQPSETETDAPPGLD